MKGNSCNLRVKEIPNIKGTLKIINEKEEDSDSFFFLMQMKEIIVKEVHFYTYEKNILGYQVFYQYHNQIVTKGLVIDIPEKYHEDLIKLGCSEKELEEEIFGAFYKKISFKETLGIYLDNCLKYENPFIVKKSIYRFDISNYEYIYKIKTVTQSKNPNLSDIISMYICTSKNNGLRILEKNEENKETFNEYLNQKNQQIVGFICKFYSGKPNHNCVNLIQYLAPIFSTKPKDFDSFVNNKLKEKIVNPKSEELEDDLFLF
jgi:hypothetical protein